MSKTNLDEIRAITAQMAELQKQLEARLNLEGALSGEPVTAGQVLETDLLAVLDPENWQEQVGSIVKGLRRAGPIISQEELKEISGVGLSTVKRIESGKGDYGLGNLVKVVDGLNAEMVFGIQPKAVEPSEP